MLTVTTEEPKEISPPEVNLPVVEIAYQENVSDWISAITNYFTVTGIEQTTWSELLENLDIAPVEISLGLLLGNFSLSQIQDKSSSFYDNEIFVQRNIIKM